MTSIKVELVDMAYASAFVEADGCVYLNSADVSVRVTNRNRDVLQWFQEKFGGVEREKVNPKGCFEWVIYGDNAISFLDMIEPYMKFKIPQCKIAREFHDLRGIRGVKTSDEVILARSYLKNEMSKEKSKWRSN